MSRNDLPVFAKRIHALLQRCLVDCLLSLSATTSLQWGYYLQRLSAEPCEEAYANGNFVRMRIALGLTGLLFTACVSAESPTFPNTQLDSSAELDSGLKDRTAPTNDAQVTDAADSGVVTDPPTSRITFVGYSSYRGKGAAVTGDVALPTNCKPGDWLLALLGYTGTGGLDLPKLWTQRVTAKYISPAGFSNVLLAAEHTVTGNDDLKFVAPGTNDAIPNRLDLVCYRNVLRAEQPKSSTVTPKATTGLVETLGFRTQFPDVVPLYGFATAYQTNSQTAPLDTVERVAHADDANENSIFLFEQTKPIALGTTLPPLAFLIPSAQGQVDRAAVFSLVLVPTTP
jgi:hypothetical protein